jgi:hypothetical protein
MQRVAGVIAHALAAWLGAQLDEASMIDLPMMSRLIDALPAHGRVIFLGDRDQLRWLPGWAPSRRCSVLASVGINAFCASVSGSFLSAAPSFWRR